MAENTVPTVGVEF